MAPKNKPNAFLFFMLEWKKNEEKKGRKFPNGLKDVQTDPDCNEKWRNLSEREKAHYKSLEKKTKAQPNLTRRTGLGESLNALERAHMKEQEFHDTMIEYISSLVQKGIENHCIEKLEFHVIHVNFFYSRTLDKNELEYYPAEIAIAEFSLEKGVSRIYHQIVNEKIKMGFTCAAKEQSVNTHHIPIDAPFGKSNYQEIFKDICSFLEPAKKNGKLPPLYTLYNKDDVHIPAKSVLSRFLIADQKPEDYLLLYSLEDLFSKLHIATNEQVGAMSIEPIVATIELKKDPFAYKLGLECDYHGELKVGVLYCSQSYVKRWIFVICSYCCDQLGIRMVPGVHMPKDKKESMINMGLLNRSFSSISLNDSRRCSSSLSMTGVSSDYRQRVSERTAKEEQLRRAQGGSIQVIDHSKVYNVKKIQEPIERPLRPPITRSAVTYFESTDTESIDFSEDSFPMIGRGSTIKKKVLEKKASAGHGCAARL